MGHTDILGAKSRNDQLSLERAKIQTDRIKKYLSFYLGLENQDELENWLKKHDVTLTYKGYGDSRAYIPNNYENQFISSKGPDLITKKDRPEMDNSLYLFGNNSLPEGRIINRRV